jgi:Spy/CpxP family protein refolding chaperone
MRGLLTHNIQLIENMKPIITLVGGAMLRAIAAPVVVTGRTAQGLAKGGMHACMTVDKLGRTAELKGLKIADDGAGRIDTARVGLSKSREQRKLERVEAKLRKAEKANLDRRARIQELEMQQEASKVVEQLSKNGMAEMLQKSQEAWLLPTFAGQPR